jgi:hypothetical protein
MMEKHFCTIIQPFQFKGYSSGCSFGSLPYFNFGKIPQQCFVLQNVLSATAQYYVTGLHEDRT